MSRPADITTYRRYSLGSDEQIEGTVPKETKVMKLTRLRAEARADNLMECRGICMFFLFLIIFTVAMLLDMQGTSSLLVDHIRSTINDGPWPMKLDSVTSVPLFYDYLRFAIVPALYQNNSDTIAAQGLSSYYHPIDVANRMVGGVRLRQVRVPRVQGCQIGPLFVNFNTGCYPKPSPNTEDTVAFGKNLQFTWESDPRSTQYRGFLGTYSPSGYMQTLPTVRSAAMAKIDELENDNFLGPWTRALFIDFVVWNTNTGTYATATLNVEFGASNGVANHMALLAIRPNSVVFGGTGSFLEMLSNVFLLLLFLMLLYFLAEESLEMRKGVVAYVQDGWNLLDWANMVLLVAGFGVRVFAYVEASDLNIGMEQLTDKDAFTALRFLGAMVEMVRLINGINSVIIFGKVVKYLRHIPYVKDLIKTFWTAMDLFVPFLVLLIVCFIGFGICFTVGFGDRFFELSTLWTSLSYLSRAFLKDIALLPAYSYMPAFGALLILVFYIVFLVLGVNMLFATITDALLTDKFESARAPRKKKPEDDIGEDEPVEEFVKEVKKKTRRFLRRNFPKIYKRVYGKRRKRTSLEVDKDNAQDAKEDNEDFEMDLDSESDNSYFNESEYGLPTKQELMNAVDHMSGQMLSELAIVGIEVKSELHDVCERVAQMQMAVEELSMRTDSMRLDQEEFIAELEGTSQTNTR